MELSEIRDETRFITRTDSVTFSDANILREANIAIKKIILEILKVEGYKNIAGKHVATTLLSTDGLVSGDLGFDGEYPFPTDMLRPTRFELLYDTNERPKIAYIYDQIENPLSETDDDDLVVIASESNPVIKFFHDSYFIRPLKTTAGDIAGGINIWYEARQANLVNDTDSPTFEESLHDLVPLMIAERFYLRHPSKRNVAVLKEKEDVMKQLRSFYKRRVPKVKQMRPLQTNFA